ncbi:MAG TPA: TIGR03862 family flavoprotein [Thiopseudomonas sp.]|nr:TIGR03862 family flavoprotein [Thiopseudomonas sp.]
MADSQDTLTSAAVCIVGGGPAGLMAAEVLAQAGHSVHLFDAMPSLGRKFLLAGIGGLNITHSEATSTFVQRYCAPTDWVSHWLAEFDAQAVRDWVHGLGIETFVGSSGRVFPKEMKAAPLLRAWLQRLRSMGVKIHTRSRWLGWDSQGALRIVNAEGERAVQARAVLLALGGGSWPRLGSDAAWIPILQGQGVEVTALEASNCGFDVVGWSTVFADKYMGAPVKNTALSVAGQAFRQGEWVVTAGGIEGSLVYALSAPIRQQLTEQGRCTVLLDCLPHKTLAQVEHALTQPRAKKTLKKYLQARLGLEGVKAALIREFAPAESLTDMQQLAGIIKALPIELLRARPMVEAISTAGGIRAEMLDSGLMLKSKPGVFCAGEMLDWDAPTGGYLLTACLASGFAAGQGMLRWLAADAKL